VQVLEPVADVLTTIPEVLRAVSKTAVMPPIPQVLPPVEDVLAAVTQVLSTVREVLQPIAHVFAPVGTPGEALCPQRDGSRDEGEWQGEHGEAHRVLLVCSSSRRIGRGETRGVKPVP
jgi:hypothetical protein